MNRKSNILMMTFTAAGALLAQTVPDGTAVKLRLNESLSSHRATVGQGVNLSVAEDVMVGDKVVIESGARATGVITLAEHKKSVGRAGKLDFMPEKVQIADGRMISLRTTPQVYSGKGKGMTTGIVTAGLAVAFWPAAPFALMIKGKDVDIPSGVTFTSFTDAKFTVNDTSAGRNSLVSAGPVAVSAGTATVSITADASDADIEIDGKFMGQTPSTVSLLAGEHRILVRYQTATWERTLQVVAGNAVSLKAEVQGTGAAPAEITSQTR